MLKPKFEITQSDVFVVLKIYAPYTKVANVEISIEGNEFSFYAKPYILRLSFPGQVEDDGSTCKYDVDSGSYTIHVKKLNDGQLFQNLDLLTTLLCKDKTSRSRPLIEVVSSKVDLPSVEKRVLISWNEEIDDDSCSYGFGFANKIHDMPALETLHEVISLDDPGSTSSTDRSLMRMECENEKFDSDYYLADLFEDELVEDVLDYRPWWESIDSNITFSEEENQVLQSLPNKEYLLDDTERKQVFMGLVDILFGFVYNSRVTDDEDNVESSWTIRTVSSTLTWCDTPSTIKAILIASFRRILCYPQYRSWKLAKKLQKDVVEILKGGQRCVLRCLLRILLIFRDSDTAPCYLLNDIYINDYCIWIQKEPICDETLTSLASAIEGVKLSKSEVGLELDLIEKAAKLVMEETSELRDSNPAHQDQLVDELVTLSI